MLRSSESPPRPRDVTALEALNNIDAMLLTVNQVPSGDIITVDLLFKTHRRLLAGTRLEELGGTFRKE
jgi:hypothetical protein